MSTRKYKAVFEISGGVGASFKQAFGSSEKAIGGLTTSIRKLERERRTVGKTIKELTKAGKETGEFRRQSERLGTQIDALRRKQERYNKALAFGNKAQGIGSSMMRTGAASAAALAGVGVASAGVQDSEIRLGSVVDKTDKNAIRDARASARKIGLSGLTGLREAYDSQYALNSAGIQGAASRFGAGVIAKVAKITSGASEEVSEVVATAYNNLGAQLEGDFEDRFNRIGDLLTKAQLKYQIRDFNQLGESMKKGAAIISTYRVEVSQGVAALGELNSAGLQGSLAGTGFAAVMRNMSKASEELGFGLVRNARGNLDLVATLKSLRETTKDFDTDERAAVLQRLFGDEGLPAVVALLKDVDGMADRFADVATDSLGIVDREIEAFSNSTSVNWQKFKNSVVIVSDALGRTLLPTVNTVFSAIGALAGKIAGWSDEHPRLTKLIGGTVAGLTALLLVGGGTAFTIGKIATMLPALSTGFTILSSTVGFLGRAVLPLIVTGIRAIGAAFMANPIGLIITGIATAAFLVWKYWEPIKGFFAGLWETIKKGFAIWYDFTVGRIMKLGAVIAKVGDFFGIGDDEKKDSRASAAVSASRGSRAVANAVANQSGGMSHTETRNETHIAINPLPGQNPSEIADEVMWRLNNQNSALAGGALFD